MKNQIYASIIYYPYAVVVYEYFYRFASDFLYVFWTPSQYHGSGRVADEENGLYDMSLIWNKPTTRAVRMGL